MGVQIPPVPKSDGQTLINHINDRLRRISEQLGTISAAGKPGAAGATGPSGAGGSTVSAYAVPVSGGVATPDASHPLNILMETADTFVATPANPPAGPNITAWQMIIVQITAGNSTSFASTYNFDITATDASSPINTGTTLNLSTDSAGTTSLVSFPSTDQPI